MTWLIVLLSAAFTAWRFTTPGHAVSPSGSVEALAHVWMGVLLVLAFQETRQWWRYTRHVMGQIEPQYRSFPWAIHACWFVPSMVEFVLFLRSPFNPF